MVVGPASSTGYGGVEGRLEVAMAGREKETDRQKAAGIERDDR